MGRSSTAIVLSRIGRIGPLIWHMPPNANLALRELGITLFLDVRGAEGRRTFLWGALQHPGTAVDGLRRGDHPRAAAPRGVDRPRRFEAEFHQRLRRARGSMTDPPALAFANTINGSDAPAVAYATVYPMTMLLRILVAQLLVVFFAR